MRMWTYANCMSAKNMHKKNRNCMVKNDLVSSEYHGFVNGQIYYGLFVF